jgi:hypothetical protein
MVSVDAILKQHETYNHRSLSQVLSINVPDMVSVRLCEGN